MSNAAKIGLVALGLVAGLALGAYWRADIAQAQVLPAGVWQIGIPNDGLGLVAWRINAVTGQMDRCSGGTCYTYR